MLCGGFSSLGDAEPDTYIITIHKNLQYKFMYPSGGQEHPNNSLEHVLYI